MPKFLSKGSHFIPVLLLLPSIPKKKKLMWNICRNFDEKGYKGKKRNLNYWTKLLHSYSGKWDWPWRKKSGKVIHVNLLINVSIYLLLSHRLCFPSQAIACPFCPGLLCNAKLSSLLNISRNFDGNGAKEKKLTKIIWLKCYILIQERRPKKEKKCDIYSLNFTSCFL